MKSKRIWQILMLGVGFFLIFGFVSDPDWGFWGHRRINKLAVFTLPEEMFPLFKNRISYLEEHAVDPDKRRYATVHEAVRHYIDIDQWGTYPFEDLPRKFDETLVKYCDYYLVYNNGDSIKLKVDNSVNFALIAQDTLLKCSRKQMAYFFNRYIMPQYYEDQWTISTDSLKSFFKKTALPVDATALVFKDKFTEHGILPYYLEIAIKKLTNAFVRKNEADIIRNAADIGHYIGDAHVPLHTTKNYNGQLTEQVGIHAFWESRIPELFADKQYDYLVGKATYIADPNAYFWNIVLESHQLLDSVLLIEKRLKETFPTDNQFCYDERLGQTVRIQCEAFAAAYQDAMQGMVEQRMTKAVQAIGSVWYTAWVDAGQPDLSKLDEIEIVEEVIKNNPNIKAREHE